MSLLFTHFSSARLWWILGRRLKGGGQTRNGEEEPPLAPWGPGGERAGRKDGMFEAGSAAGRAQSEDELHKLKYHFNGWFTLHA